MAGFLCAAAFLMCLRQKIGISDFLGGRASGQNNFKRGLVVCWLFIGRDKGNAKNDQGMHHNRKKQRQAQTVGRGNGRGGGSGHAVSAPKVLSRTLKSGAQYTR